MLTPRGAMTIAIEEAQKGIGFVAPNPPVGCAILDSAGNLLAKGYHRIYGGDHAEVDALKQIKDQSVLKGAVMYVTLEPCAHEGKTPSCARRIVELPLSKVVYGLVDPNPLVQGKGLEILEDAGIQTVPFDGLRNELERLPEVFLWNKTQQKTFVSVKVATTLDGHMAHVSGDSKWLTGELAREYVHYLRAAHDAILVGRETFLKDNPSLNIRHPKFIGKNNKVIVLDSNGVGFKKFRGSNLAKAHNSDDIFWICGESAEISDSSVQVIKVPVVNGLLNLKVVLEKLYEHEIYSILVEGGARVISSFLNEGLVNRFYQFIAPQILGSRTGVSYSRDFGVATLPDRRELRDSQVMTFDKDVMITGRMD